MLLLIVVSVNHVKGNYVRFDQRDPAAPRVWPSFLRQLVSVAQEGPLRLWHGFGIEWVAKISVNDGYDIASYDADSDKELNRFIEVKSYTGNDKYFYLSSNEYKTAKRRRQKYWLYLVNRDKLADRNYAPTMIQDPYINVFTSNDWEMESQNWKFKQIN